MRFVVGFLYLFCIYLRVAFYHVIMCISFCIRVRLMHPSIFPVARFVIRHSYALRRSPFVSCCEWVLNVLGMDRGLPSGLGIALVDRLSSFVPFGGRLVLQRLTAKASLSLQPNSPSKVAQNPSNSPPCSRSFNHDRVAENRSSFGLS